MPCTATTKAGEPCKAKPLKDTDRCLAHSDEATRTSMNFQQGPRPGRPPNPRAVDVLRERLDAELDEWLAPLYEARNATRHVVVGNGPSAHVEEVPDLPTRLAAFREMMDRVHGKPKQTQELSGSVGLTLADLASLADDA